MDLDRVGVATFNLYNLQLPGRRMNPFQEPWTPAEYERKVAWTAAVLDRLDADVVGVQELWHADAMADVLSREPLRGRYELLAEGATGERITCAALVRTGLLAGDPEWVETFPDAVRLESSDPMDPQAPAISVQLRGFSRPVLRFRVALRDAPPATEVFVAHLKSKLPTQVNEEPWYDAQPELHRDHRNALGAAISTIRRTAEATALRVLLTQVMKGTQTPVVVLGDLNDGAHSNPTTSSPSSRATWSGSRAGAPTSACTPRRRCRSTATAATSTTPTSTRTCGSRSTTCWSASSSTTTACAASGSSTASASPTTTSTTRTTGRAEPGTTGS